MGLRLPRHLSSTERQSGPRLIYIFRRRGLEIAIHDHNVGQMSGFKRAQPVIFVPGIGTSGGIGMQSLMQRRGMIVISTIP